MKSFERGKLYENLEESIARIAYAYGFTMPPVAIPKKYATQNDENQRDVSLSIALLKNIGGVSGQNSAWGSVRGDKKSTHLSFALLSTKHPVAHAVVVVGRMGQVVDDG